jgi:tRNA dimethylallyltransferase
MASLRPIIAICGTTGVGKSKLAVELALRIAEGAAVINADSMQVYDGLDILTNKLPREDMKGVPHLLMGFKSPDEQYVVGQWVEEAAKAVSLTPFLSSDTLTPESRDVKDRRHS